MRKADNLPPSCAAVTKSGNLNFLEPSEPVRACNEIALLFTSRRLFSTCNLSFHPTVTCMNRFEELRYSSPMICSTYTLQNDSEVTLELYSFGLTEYVLSKV